MKNVDPVNNTGLVGSPVKAIQLIRKSGAAGELEDKVTTDFIRLMDLMEDQRAVKINDLVSRQGARERAVQEAKS